MRIAGLTLLLLLTLTPVVRASPEGGQQALRDAAVTAIHTIPTTQPAAGFTAPGVRALFIDASPWHGKPTRAFAWYGVPADLKPNEKYPAVVLVHGGGGTAFANWVQMWTKRGYAAIAVDTCGQLPRRAKPNDATDKSWQRDELGGPPGWGGFEQVDDPPQDQWPYHATLDVVLAHSLLRSLPEVDPDRIGLVGISWGGYLTCIAASLDPRFKFAVPVYGCGFIGEESAWLKDFDKMGHDRAVQWIAAWDASQYLANARMPVLWVDGTNDSNYPLDILKKSYDVPPGPRTLVTRVRMKHSHTAGWAPEEIGVFADSIVEGGTPLTTVKDQGHEGDRVWVTYQASAPVVKAELNYTTDEGLWRDRKWETISAAIDTSTARATAKLPTSARVYYFNLVDDRGLLVSAPLQILAR